MCFCFLCRRANLDCDFWDGPVNILTGNVPCSAQCMRLSDLYYSVSVVVLLEPLFCK